MSLRSRWVRVGGLRLHVREAMPVGGPTDRPTIVLIHGFIISSRYMRPLARVLAERGWRVVAPDLPGYGLSEGDGHTPDVPEMARWVVRILDALGETRPAIVIGNSVGCQVGVRLAVQAPERVERLVLVGPTFDPSAGLVRHILRLVADIPRERLRLWALHVPDYLHAGPRRVLRTLRHVRRHRIELDLPKVEAPVLVLRGSRDPIAPGDWIRQAAALAPCGRAATIPGSPHASNYSTPRRLARMIAPFLSSSRPRRSIPHRRPAEAPKRPMAPGPRRSRA